MTQPTLDLDHIDKNALEAIFNHQNSGIMANVKITVVLEQCCLEKVSKLFVNAVDICAKTLVCYQEWLRERQYRITGTTCYGLFTYMKNKKPDWQKKCDSFFDITNFKSQYTEYGRKTEKVALQVYVKNTGNQVLQTGLIISQQNPWFGFSPDGIIFKDGKPDVLLEIKCPFKGKDMTINAAIKKEFGKCLKFSGNKISLKKQHKYYGQVQLGMAIINVQKTVFLIYASFDKSYIIINIKFDKEFVINMLTNLTKLYFNTMLHKICLRNDETKENRENNNSV